MDGSAMWANGSNPSSGTVSKSSPAMSPSPRNITSIDGGSCPFTPIVLSAISDNSLASPDLTIRVSIAQRPSTVTATNLPLLAALKETTSLNDPPDAN